MKLKKELKSDLHLTGRLFFSLLYDFLDDAGEEPVHLVAPFVWEESGNGSKDVGKSHCAKKEKHCLFSIKFLAKKMYPFL